MAIHLIIFVLEPFIKYAQTSVVFIHVEYKWRLLILL